VKGGAWWVHPSLVGRKMQYDKTRATWGARKIIATSLFSFCHLRAALAYPAPKPR
jgi:hypothetical protein